MEDKRKAIPFLRAWRLSRLMKQGELAAAAGLGEQTIFRLERPGERANELTIHKIAKALGISVQQLLNEPPPENVRAA